MIGICDCEIQAANPSMPLYPLRAFINSPSSLRIRNVPKKIGTWNITSVQLVAAYPDNTIKTANCKLIGCVWVGTIQGSSTSGTSENGYTVYASGIDENGNEVSGYVLGKGLVEILENDGTITPDVPLYYVHLYDEQPENPKEGDMWQVDGDWYIYQDYPRQIGLSESELLEYISPLQTSVATLENHMEAAEQRMDNIDGMIPAQASAANQLADKAFVNSSVQTATANFRGNWATWNDVPDQSEYYPVDYAGSRTPTVNDYLVVQDVTVDGKEGTWRYKYSGTWATDGKAGWLPEYQVNETPMTAAQLAALNSNITAAKVVQYDNALANINYVFHSASPDSQHPTLPTSAFPIYFNWSGGLTFSDMTGLVIRAGVDYPNTFVLSYGDEFNIAYFAADTGVFINGAYNSAVTFNRQSSATLIFPYVLQDRAINTISVTADNPSIYVTLPDPITDHARDFMIRIVASAGTYSTAPTLNMSGVTLMNADGEMPEIKTDTTNACTTLIYFSEIASNVFLCKGEQLEAITL